MQYFHIKALSRVACAVCSKKLFILFKKWSKIFLKLLSGMTTHLVTLHITLIKHYTSTSVYQFEQYIMTGSSEPTVHMRTVGVL